MRSNFGEAAVKMLAIIRKRKLCFTLIQVSLKCLQV